MDSVTDFGISPIYSSMSMRPEMLTGLSVNRYNASGKGGRKVAMAVVSSLAALDVAYCGVLDRGHN